MAKKFSIKRDPTFTTTVNLPAPGQAPVPVDFTFKWMDRKEVADFQDSAMGFYESVKDKALAEKWGNAEWADARISYDFDCLKTIVVGWDIEEDFNDDNLRALVESGSDFPAVIVRGYLAAYEKAREGN